jgi:hypothetical protein
MSIMTRYNSSKINQLLKVWPKGTVAVHSWLGSRGIYRQLVDSYQKTSWLVRIGHGAFVRADDRVDWTGGLYAIQEQLGIPVHAGGKTALQMAGYSHYLPLGQGQRIFLFGSINERLPGWFRQRDWGVNIFYTMTNLFPRGQNLGLSKKEKGEYSVTVSSPERAMMEILYFVPRGETFEEARLLMEGLSTLRPKLVQKLLEKCNSIKVKRLFMYLAEECGLPWVSKVDVSKVDLGRGKRVVVKGGVFDQKYRITVEK